MLNFITYMTYVNIQDTAYEYFVDVKNKNWTMWEEKLRSGWRYQPKYECT